MNRLLHWAHDYVHVAKGHLLTYFYRKPPAHYLGFVLKDAPPVVLIPGLGEPWGFMKRIGDAISNLGCPIYILPELRYNTMDIPTAAACVQRLIQEQDLHHVVLIGHSKGGLIGKYLLVFANKDARISKLIAITTPFFGSTLANLFPLAAYQELKPSSPIITKLQTHTEVNGQITTISAQFDNHVWPQNSTQIQGAEHIEIPTSGHHRILFTEALIDTVKKVLTDQRSATGNLD